MDIRTQDQTSEAKKLLRRTMHIRRRSIPAEIKVEYDRTITACVLKLPPVSQSVSISCYVSMGDEVSTADILTALVSLGKSVSVPRVSGKDLILYRIRGPEDLEPGVFGLMEPKTTCRTVDPDDVECHLIPGLAFDREGRRLGWGKGYYDRLLARKTAVNIGLAYTCQISEEPLPHTDSDIPMDLIVTPQGVIERNPHGYHFAGR